MNDFVGLKLFKDLPNVNSMMFIHVADLDCVSTYPTSESCLNLSKTTTKYEFSKFAFLNYEQQREVSLNLTAGSVNALEILQTTCSFPTHNEVFKAFTAKTDSNVITFNPPVVEDTISNYLELDLVA